MQLNRNPINIIEILQPFYPKKILEQFHRASFSSQNHYENVFTITLIIQ